ATDGGDRDLPLAMYSMAHATGKLGEFGEAHRLFLELMELQIQYTGDTHDTLAYWLNGHGDLLANMGATALADAAFNRAMEIYEIIEKPKGHFDLSVTLVGLGKVARDRGDLASAEDLMRRGLAIRIDTIREAHSFTQLARVDLADVIRRRGRLDEARATFDEAIANLESNGDGEHPTVAQALTGLAEIEIAENDPDEAIQLLERAIAMTEGSIGRDHLDNVQRRLLIADALELRGDPDAAAVLREPAVAQREDILADWNEAIAAESAAP
ncbi:MAG: tetratricopeptide repeat protein, partial [Pseudomonadota bacterium]